MMGILLMINMKEKENYIMKKGNIIKVNLKMDLKKEKELNIIKIIQ